MADPELDSFKRISLPDYVASVGYAIDRRKSSRGSLVMRHENSDKIVISRQPSGHYTYWSPRDDKDHGTIIDFIRHRTGMNLGEIRKTLRAWTGWGTPARPWLPELQSTAKDRAAVEARYASMQIAHRHPYLETERGIPALTLQYWRFDGRIKTDIQYGNPVFPHYDAEGLCGFELRNSGFRGFAGGGAKGLWLSKASASDQRLVICESAIDGLSYAVLFPDGYARYASIGGKMNTRQPELIRAQVNLLPSGGEVVAAMDADEAGRRLADEIEKAFGHAGRPDLTFRRQEPLAFNDWNDALRGRHSLQKAEPV